MSEALSIRHRFVEDIPERLAPATLYVSLPFAIAVHLCACGCGAEVVTPIAPEGWSLVWTGETVSLRPSVGNARLPCRSHYLIVAGQVVWIPHAARTRETVEGLSGGVAAWFATHFIGIRDRLLTYGRVGRRS